MRVLELFSGTGSVGKALNKLSKDVEIVSLDIHPKYNPTHATDILKWNYKSSYPPYYFDIIWASPPCTEYSKAKTIGVRNLPLADRIVMRTLSIIKYFQPRFWFVENPSGGGLLEKRYFMKKYERYKIRCTYCHYGTPFKKPTNIWTNMKHLNLRYCSKDDPCAYKKLHSTHKHTAQKSKWSQYPPKYAIPGTSDSEKVYPIPTKLTKHIFKGLFV